MPSLCCIYTYTLNPFLYNGHVAEVSFHYLCTPFDLLRRSHVYYASSMPRKLWRAPGLPELLIVDRGAMGCGLAPAMLSPRMDFPQVTQHCILLTRSDPI